MFSKLYNIETIRSNTLYNYIQQNHVIISNVRHKGGISSDFNLSLCLTLLIVPLSIFTKLLLYILRGQRSRSFSKSTLSSCISSWGIPSAPLTVSCILVLLIPKFFTSHSHQPACLPLPLKCLLSQKKENKQKRDLGQTQLSILTWLHQKLWNASCIPSCPHLEDRWLVGFVPFRLLFSRSEKFEDIRLGHSELLPYW